MHNNARYHIVALHVQADALIRYAQRVRELAAHALSIEDMILLSQLAVEVDHDVASVFDRLIFAVAEYEMQE